MWSIWLRYNKQGTWGSRVALFLEGELSNAGAVARSVTPLPRCFGTTIDVVGRQIPTNRMEWGNG
jgi:hypothetical protein